MIVRNWHRGARQGRETRGGVSGAGRGGGESAGGGGGEDR